MYYHIVHHYLMAVYLYADLFGGGAGPDFVISSSQLLGEVGGGFSLCRFREGERSLLL